jgi:hypothetical protein
VLPEASEALAAVLLRAFKVNLETLSLDFGFLREDSDTITLIRSIQSSDNPMPYLRSVSMSQSTALCHVNRAVGIRHLVPFLRLKSVTKFVGRRIQGFGWENPTSMHRFNAVDLRLFRSNSNDISMRSFVGCFHSLKGFEYSNYMTTGAMDLSAIRERLSHAKQCLEILRIGYWSVVLGRPFYHASSLGSLSDFTTLKTVAVDSYILLGLAHTHVDSEDSSFENSGGLIWNYTPQQISAFATAFPQSLGTLHLSNCSPAIFDCMTELFDQGHLPPNLENIDLTFRSGLYTESCNEDIKALEDLALAKGIRFSC